MAMISIARRIYLTLGIFLGNFDLGFVAVEGFRIANESDCLLFFVSMPRTHIDIVCQE